MTAQRFAERAEAVRLLLDHGRLIGTHDSDTLNPIFAHVLESVWSEALEEAAKVADETRSDMGVVIADRIRKLKTRP